MKLTRNPILPLAVATTLATGIGHSLDAEAAPRERNLAALTFSMNVGGSGNRERGEVGWDSARFTLKAGRVDNYNIGTETLGIEYAPSGPTRGFDFFFENGSYNGLTKFGRADGDHEVFYGPEDRFTNNFSGLIARLGSGGSDMSSARITLLSTRQDNYGASDLVSPNSYAVLSWSDGATPDWSYSNLLIGILNCRTIQEINQHRRNNARKRNKGLTKAEIKERQRRWANSSQGKNRAAFNRILRQQYGSDGEEAVKRFWASFNGLESNDMKNSARNVWRHWNNNRTYLGGNQSWDDCMGTTSACDGSDSGGGNPGGDQGDD